MTRGLPLKLVACCAAALAGAATSPAGSNATPPIGTEVVTLSQQTVDGTEYMVNRITIDPGGSTGWHTHRGAVYGIVTAGVLTHFDGTCHQDGIYDAGEPITDPTGPDRVHIGRNLGTVPAVLSVTYVDPVGTPPSDSAPDPGCGFS